VRLVKKQLREALIKQKNQRYNDFYEKLDSQFSGFSRKTFIEESKNAKKRQKFFRGRFSARLFGGPK
jgi:hypothetical protein